MVQSRKYVGSGRSRFLPAAGLRFIPAGASLAQSQHAKTKTVHPVWYEPSQPHLSKTTLELHGSTRFLWIGLGAIPLLAVGLMRQARRRRA